MNKKWLLSLLLVVTFTVITACSGGDESAEDNNDEATQEEPQEGGESAEHAEMPEPDLEGIPEVVAEVNSEEITREEFETSYEVQFQRSAMQSQMSGEAVDQEQLKGQVAESMVGAELLIQEADSRDFTASEEDTNAYLDELVELNKLQSQDELLAAFEEQGTTEEELMAQVEQQVKVNQLIAEEAGDTEPTEEEMQELYDQLVAQQEQTGGGEAEIPSFEEMKPKLEEQLKTQKENDASLALIEELRKDADVTVNL